MGTIGSGRRPFRNGRYAPGRPGCVDQESDVMYRLITQFLRDRSGATSIEYGLIAVGIVGAVVVTVYALGTKVQELFALVNERFQ